jgi:hypothetical protein
MFLFLLKKKRFQKEVTLPVLRTPLNAEDTTILKADPSVVDGEQRSEADGELKENSKTYEQGEEKTLKAMC